MYLRTVQRRQRDGTPIRYLQLAHNRWDRAARHSTVQVLYTFGRADQIDRAAIERLIHSLSRALPAERAPAVTAGPELEFAGARQLGGPWLLDQLWQRLGIDAICARLLRGRRLDPRAERAVFAMVANRALEPLSKLSCATWVTERAEIRGLLALDEDTCYRSMDWLVEIEAELAEQVYWAVAELTNLEVDVLFFDTTSTYWETDQADAPSEDAPKGFRAFGHSKDHRPDRPQVVIGLAVTRDGIPIRVWTWPGNASDQDVIRQVKDDLRGWRLGRVVWVADTGFESAQNRRYLQRAGGHYILGEKLRGNDREAQAALGRQGRYHPVRDNLEVKEVVLDDGTMRDRFVICRNPEEAKRDATIREQLIRQLATAIAGSDTWTATRRSEQAGALRTQPGLARFLRVTAGGKLRVDRAAVAADAHLDGKFLLRTSDPTLSTEDIALGYKQLLQVERAWRDLKTRLELRPVYHYKPERIRAHVVLCWLALLLVRLVENATQGTWRNDRRELEKLVLGEFRGPSGTVWQASTVTPAQADLLRACQVPEPPRFHRLHPAASPAA